MTHQIPDKLIYKNQEYFLKDQLLERYFHEFPEKKPERKLVESCIWRGYIATFEIINDKLYVANIELLLDSDYKSKSILNEVFPKNTVFNWYSGLINIDSVKKNAKEPLNSTFEYLEINKGKLIKKWMMNYEELESFKKDQYEYFIISEDAKPIYELFKKNNKGITEDSINEIILDNILYYTKEVYVG